MTLDGSVSTLHRPDRRRRSLAPMAYYVYRVTTPTDSFPWVFNRPVGSGGLALLPEYAFELLGSFDDSLKALEAYERAQRADSSAAR